ncbi:YhgE/Pip domain-containing protein [Austwickia chelonae]|uniref:YhgE/Pip domain-containing protein n=1 Tax=Austwickia chelonae TaxID=100225 RepID=UPI000E27EF14|nr:YhgE/Pip domain-containing protein [Austwickia chelonae]
MRSHRLALAELLRLTSAPMIRIALVALVLIPSLYAGLYLYANRDPYARLSSMPAAIVSEDQGATLANGERIQLGKEIAEQLAKTKKFDWSVIDRESATQGVKDETYHFAVIIPSGFSADLSSVGTGNPRQAHLEQITNDANGYLTRTISNQVIAEITKSIASKLSSTTASKMLDGFNDIRVNLTTASDGAVKLSDGTTQLLDGQKKLRDGTEKLVDGTTKAHKGSQELAQGAGKLSQGMGKLADGTAELPAKTRQLADGARKVADGNAQVAAAGKQLAEGAKQIDSSRSTLKTDLAARLDAIDKANKAAEKPDPAITEATKAARQALTDVDGRLNTISGKVTSTSGKLGQLSTGSTAVADGAEKLAGASVKLSDGIKEARTGSNKLADGARKMTVGLAKLDDGAHKLHDGTGKAVQGVEKLDEGAHKLGDGLKGGVNKIPATTPEQRSAAAQVMGAPVAIERAAAAEAENYGAGLAPFFLALSLWIGAYTLFLVVRPVSLRAVVANQPGWRIAFSGWLTPALLGTCQAVAVFLLIGWGLGFRMDKPIPTVLFLIGVSCVYVAILLALASRFGAVGKFVGLVFMVLQLVSAGGTFPWQTLPEPLQIVHHLAPMSYAVEGLRHLMYGGPLHRMPMIVAVLFAYWLLAMIATRWAALRLRIWTARRIKPDLQL